MYLFSVCLNYLFNIVTCNNEIYSSRQPVASQDRQAPPPGGLHPPRAGTHPSWRPGPFQGRHTPILAAWTLPGPGNTPPGGLHPPRAGTHPSWRPTPSQGRHTPLLVPVFSQGPSPPSQPIINPYLKLMKYDDNPCKAHKR